MEVIIDKSNIKKHYKTFGYANLIFSILLLFFLNDIDFKERLFALLGINGAYHMLYFFFKDISKNSIRKINNFNNTVITAML